MQHIMIGSEDRRASGPPGPDASAFDCPRWRWRESSRARRGQPGMPAGHATSTISRPTSRRCRESALHLSEQTPPEQRSPPRRAAGRAPLARRNPRRGAGEVDRPVPAVIFLLALLQRTRPVSVPIGGGSGDGRTVALHVCRAHRPVIATRGIGYPGDAMPPDPLQLLTFGQAAQLLGVHRSTIRRMVAAGDLEVFRWRGTTRVYRQELERFVRAHTSRGRRRPPEPRAAAVPATTPIAAMEAPMPASLAQAPSPAPPTMPPAPAPAPHVTRSIAVLEDDEHVRRFLSYALSAEGYVVQPCASYEELVELCSQAQVDLIIADAWGESTTGLDPAERDLIVELARQCPTIMTTGRDWAERVDPAELGVVAIVQKPFELEDLMRLVRATISQSA